MRASRRYADSLRGVRQAHPGQVPPQRPGKDMARRLRQVFRLPRAPHRQVLLQGGQALLQERLLQVSNPTPRCDLSGRVLKRGRCSSSHEIWSPWSLDR